MGMRALAVRVSVAICLLSGVCAQAQRTLPIDLSSGWTEKTQGLWRIRYDHRDLMAMRHPWEESAKGNFASITREIIVPSDWTGPVALSFYCSDDYHTDTWRPDGSWLTAEGLVGHRMKQVLVDDRIVWTADVSDPVVEGSSPYYRIDLGLKPGQKALVTLLAYDAVDSRTLNDKDFYQSANNEKKREDDPDAARFQTHVYWGDLYLVDGDAAPKQAARPSEKLVRAVHTRRWPLPPFGDRWEGPIALEVSAPAGIPAQGFPLRAGVPVHAGKAKDVSEIRLSAEGERQIAVQKTALGKWPDDSLQWVLLDLPVSPAMRQIELTFDRSDAGFDGKTQVKESERGVRVDAKSVQFEARNGELIADVQSRGAVKVSTLNLVLQVEGEDVPGATESVSVTEAGPFRSTIEIKGRFDSLEKTMASFRLYCSAYLHLPYVSFRLRLFNDTGVPLAVSGLQMRFTLPSEPAELRVPGADVKDGFVLSQVSEQSRTLDGAPADPHAPMFLAWKDGSIVVRQFRELYPKQAMAKGKDLIIDLVAAGKTPVVFTPGEAKSHEVWLALGAPIAAMGDVDPAQFAATVAQPPILQNARYFCSTGVIGPAAPHIGVPVLHDHMTNDFGKKQWEDFGQRFGVRDFPDSAYYGGLPKWCNNYYERMLGLWSEWFMGGDRAWYDLATDVCRHLSDVAVIHSEIPGKPWVGAIHGPGEDHVSGPWNPNLRIAGLALYANLTGTADARDAAVGAADYCVRAHAGLDSPSIRDHAGPFDAICTAYDVTGDAKYLDDGGARLEAALARMDMRRGVWPETHGSMVYRGNVPWMEAQLGRPLYLWYHATGDLRAAQALVGLAESIVCENTDWDHPGVVYGYSHNPHYPVGDLRAASAAYDLLILPIIFAAYELTEDPFFLEAAKAQWERWQREKAFDSPLNCYWNTPWLMWYLNHYGLDPACKERNQPLGGEK